MMSNELYHLVAEAQNNNSNAALSILQKFEPLLKKYAWKLHDEDAMQDLSLALLDLLPKISLDKYPTDGQITNYIATSLYHVYLTLLRKNFLRQNTEVELEDSLIDCLPLTVGQEIIDLLSAIKNLAPQQKTIIYLHYFEDYSIQSIACMLGISRQAVNKAKKTALEFLKVSLA